MEVDVRQRAADRVPLEVLENCVVRGRLALDDDVDDRVEARGARQRGAKLPLLDDDRARMTLPVQHAGNEALLAETADATRADLVGVAFGNLESDALARHRRAMVAEAGQ